MEWYSEERFSIEDVVEQRFVQYHYIQDIANRYSSTNDWVHNDAHGAHGVGILKRGLGFSSSGGASNRVRQHNRLRQNIMRIYTTVSTIQRLVIKFFNTEGLGDSLLIVPVINADKPAALIIYKSNGEYKFLLYNAIATENICKVRELALALSRNCTGYAGIYFGRNVYNLTLRQEQFACVWQFIAMTFDGLIEPCDQPLAFVYNMKPSYHYHRLSPPQ